MFRLFSSGEMNMKYERFMMRKLRAVTPIVIDSSKTIIFVGCRRAQTHVHSITPNRSCHYALIAIWELKHISLAHTEQQETGISFAGRLIDWFKSLWDLDCKADYISISDIFIQRYVFKYGKNRKQARMEPKCENHLIEANVFSFVFSGFWVLV